MARKIGFILATPAFILALMFSARAAAAPWTMAIAAPQEALPEELLQKNCQGCHDLRPIQTSAMNAEGWTKTIRTMIDDNGAEVREEDIPALVKYLVQNHGPL